VNVNAPPPLATEAMIVIAKDRFDFLIDPLTSVTWIVDDDDPTTVAVLLATPVDVLSDKSVGKAATIKAKV